MRHLASDDKTHIRIIIIKKKHKTSPPTTKATENADLNALDSRDYG